MKYCYFYIYALVFCSLYSIDVFANPAYFMPDNKNFPNEASAATDTLGNNAVDSIAYWTEDQHKQYEDSILSIFYPPLQVIEQKAVEQCDPQSPQKNLASPSNIVNPSVPNIVTLDYSKDVGEIAIQSGTSPTGAKTYEIPIQIPSGQKGFIPHISLVYNSQKGNSYMGTGWSISGLSEIARVAKSIYYDGEARGVLMDNSDAFALDGSRLIKLSQTSEYILYETETGNIKVKGYTNGDVMKYFEVFYPDGTKGIFGYTTNTNNLVSYSQKELTDLWGNQISFIYSFSDNSDVISRIYYTGGVIEFEYESYRPDTLLSYCGGKKVEEHRLLSSITCKRSSYGVLGTYTFTYSTLYERSLLTQIDYEAGNFSYNPLRFYYGENDDILSYTRVISQLSKYYVMPKLGSVNATIGRLKYLRSSDCLVVNPNTPAYYDHNYFNKHIYRNKYSGNENIFIYSDLDQSWAHVDSLKTGEGFVEVMCADLDGSQQEDIIKVRNIMYSGKDRLIFEVYRMNLLGNMFLKYTRSYDIGDLYSGFFGYKSVSPKTFHVGDFNGDGKMEVLVMGGHPYAGASYYPTTCHIFDLENNQVLFQTPLLSSYELHFFGEWETNAQTIVNATDRLLVIDYDGDGKSDVCHINSTGTHIYTFSEVANGLSSTLVYSYVSLLKSHLADRDMLAGDYNGDGQTDLFVSAPYTAPDFTPSQMFNSMGNGFFEQHSAGYIKKSSDGECGLVAQDVNSDGVHDIIEYGNLGFFTNITFNNRPLSFNVEASYPSTVKAKLIPANVCTHNAFTTLVSLKDGIVASYELPLNSTKEAMITGMVNSHGVIEKNAYQRLTDSGEPVVMPAPDPSFSVTYPYIELYEPLVVLGRSELFMNGSMIDFTKYGYGTAVYHRQGLGFRGFNSMTRNDSRQRVFSQSFDPSNFGVMTRYISPEKEGTYTYSVNVASNRISKILLMAKQETDNLNGLIANTTFSYNSYGYPLQETTSYSGDINISVRTQNNYQSNPTVANGYHLGYLTQQSVTTTRDNQSFTESTNSTSSVNRQPLEVFYRKNGNQTRKITYSYDSNGNKISETVKEYAATSGLQTSFEYDVYGQQTKEISPLNLTTRYYYDSCGRMETMRDSRYNDTDYTYDGLGHTVTITRPDGTVKSCVLSWTTSVPGALYVMTTTETGKPTTKTYYDALGREVRTSDQRFNGSYRNVDRTYDNYGRLLKVSLPFKSTAASYWNTYSYDNRDRITSISEDSGRTTTYSYNGLSTTTTEDDIAVTRTYDALGYLVSVTDPAGTVSYELAPDGQPVSITAPGNVTTSFTYDQYRRRTSLIDPSLGTTTFTYDIKGNLASETDANNNTTTYTYDQFNRLTTTTRPEFTTTRTYNTYGDVVSLTSTNGTSKMMTYDGYGRISTLKEVVGDRWLQKDYFYSLGRVDSIRYTSQRGFIVSENYGYNYGHFKTGKLNGTTTVFKLTNENNLGQPTGVETGYVSRYYAFTPYGLPTLREATLMPSLQNRDLIASYQNISYSFDPTTSNLLSRTDNNRNLTETFEYDGLNRLEYYNGGEWIDYDTKANIVERTDVGYFQYNNTQKPYAVSRATFNNSSFDTSEQNITYTSFHRPATISQGTTTTSFIYNDEGSRMQLTTNGNTNSAKYYFGGCYEGQGNKETLYLFGDYYNAPVVFVKSNTQQQVYSILRDYLGTITHVVDGNGNLVQELSYDAWGRKRSPYTWQVYTVGADSALFLGRGYCGHEHLQTYGLINMNARLYDPVVGRFLSPDPYVQIPDNSQSFNRYSYCLNNPLKYTDPTGELFIIDDWIIGAFKGLFKGENIWKSANRHATNSLKIWAGLFTLDSNKNFWQKSWELLSRFTWQLPQTMAGFNFAHITNSISEVYNVRHKYGATVLSSSMLEGTAAITIGNYITGSEKIKADPNNEIFQHEYGHYIQSQKFGYAYITAIGFPSLFNAKNGENHKEQPYELDANIRAKKYFETYIPNYNGWNYEKNPISSEKYTAGVKNKWYHDLFGFSLTPAIQWYSQYVPLVSIIGIFF